VARSDDADTRAARWEKEANDLSSQVAFLQEELALVRRKLTESPRHVRQLEERLAATQAQLARLTENNERLVATLKEARSQIVTLKEEIDRLAQPPSGYGVFLQAHEDGTVDVFTGGRKLRVAVSPSLEVEELKRGQEVLLNDALNVVDAFGYERSGEVVTLKEALAGPDGLLGAYQKVLAETGILLIADEVQTGWGRTGDHFWGYQAHGVVPDLITFAKGIGNGYALGGVVGRADVINAVPAISFSTFGGNPVSTAAGNAVIDYLLHHDLQANAKRVGTILLDGLRAATAVALTALAQAGSVNPEVVAALLPELETTVYGGGAAVGRIAAGT